MHLCLHPSVRGALEGLGPRVLEGLGFESRRPGPNLRPGHPEPTKSAAGWEAGALAPSGSGSSACRV